MKTIDYHHHWLMIMTMMCCCKKYFYTWMSSACALGIQAYTYFGSESRTDIYIMLALTLHAVKIERNLPFRFDNGVFDKHTKQTTTTMMTTTTKTKEIIPFIRPFLFDFGWPMPIERWWRWDERQIHTLSMRAYLDEESIFFFFLSFTHSIFATTSSSSSSLLFSNDSL